MIDLLNRQSAFRRAARFFGGLHDQALGGASILGKLTQVVR